MERPAQEYRPEKRPRLLDTYFEEVGPSGREFLSANSNEARALFSSSRLQLPAAVVHPSASGYAALLGVQHNNTQQALPYQFQQAPQQNEASLLLSGLATSAVASAGATRAASPPWRADDKDGHLVFELGENLTPRYKILSKLGEGTFGRVLECWDRQMQAYVAIKVIRNVQKYRDAAMIEIEVLSTLAKHDRLGTRGCVELKGWFDYRGHVCIVFEKLGPSLYDFLRKNNFRPFSVDMARDFSRQLLEAVAYMHSLTLVHTDLKPENILLVSPDYAKVPDFKAALPSSSVSDPVVRHRRVPVSSAIRVIDFGSATFESHYHCSIVSTRHYRAPEVILGLGWSYPCDLWSVGCILVELVTGEALFQTHENLEHLAMMERLLGPIPGNIIKRVERRAEKYFRGGRELNWPEGAVSRESIRAVRKLPRLRDLIMQCAEHSAGTLIDLLYSLLHFDPTQRLTAHEALQHAFFREPSRRMY